VNGFGIIWLCQDVGNDESFLFEFKDRLIACFKQNWHSKMETGEKYSWFYSFKHILQPEKYLHVLTNKWYRKAMTRFRTRTLGLKANKIWFDLSMNNRNCMFCTDESVIEDEIHFVFHCKAYDNLRNHSIVFKTDIAKRLDLVSLLNTNDNEIILMFAKFIAEATSIRRKKMETINLM
jgi:hypothetical protein